MRRPALGGRTRRATEASGEQALIQIANGDEPQTFTFWLDYVLAPDVDFEFCSGCLSGHSGAFF